MIINLYAGHNPDGKIGAGEVGILKESTEARKVRDFMNNILLSRGYRVVDCTCENAIRKKDIVPKIAENIALNESLINIGIHFNTSSTHQLRGVEIYVSDNLSEQSRIACNNILNHMSRQGFENNGIMFIHNNEELNTIKNLIIVNCCYIDNIKDCELYSPNTVASAISRGIIDTFGTKEVNILYKVKVAIKQTFIRKGPGTDSNVSLDNRGKRISKKEGTTLTIIEEKNGWGKLKSGEGWINLRQVMKLS